MLKTPSVVTDYSQLNWQEIISGCHQATYLGMSLEVEIAFVDTWAVYDVNGDVWLEGVCYGVRDGKAQAFNALKAEIA
ncbi:MAG: hypothetical protein WA949_13320 [Phormidesmis sp.]